MTADQMLSQLTAADRDQLETEARVQSSLIESGKDPTEVLVHLAEMLRELRGRAEHNSLIPTEGHYE